MRGLLRVTLVCLALSAAVIAVQGTIAPRSFYDGFPFGRGWVELLPPYNEHLVRDVAGLLSRVHDPVRVGGGDAGAALVVPLCVAWAVSALLKASFTRSISTASPPAMRSRRSAGWPPCWCYRSLAIWVVRRDVIDLAA